MNWPARRARNAERSRQSAELVRAVGRSVTDANGALTSMAGSMAAIEDRARRCPKIVDHRRDRISDQHPGAQRRRRAERAREGMGFAVVADEVRNLRSGPPWPRDTTALIERSARPAQDGVSKPDRMSATVGQITNSVTSLSALVEEVSEATPAGQRLEQVRQSVVQMEHVTQTTAATAERAQPPPRSSMPWPARRRRWCRSSRTSLAARGLRHAGCVRSRCRGTGGHRSSAVASMCS